MEVKAQDIRYGQMYHVSVRKPGRSRAYTHRFVELQHRDETNGRTYFVFWKHQTRQAVVAVGRELVRVVEA